MKRYTDNPIITRKDIRSALPELRDLTSVFNPGAVKFEEWYYLMLRAQNRGRETYFIMAKSRDGYAFDIEDQYIQWKGIEKVTERIFHIYDSWDIQGLKSAVYIDGTLNDPADIDYTWYVELTFPWKVLEECAYKPAPLTRGDYWRVNFSRVQWEHEIIDGKYVKADKREDNWVWSPQGLINMHYPEMWGFVHFTDQLSNMRMIGYDLEKIEIAKWDLRQLFYKQKEIFKNHGHFSDDSDILDSMNIKPTGYQWPPLIYVTPTMWEAVLIHKTEGNSLHISQDGRTWLEN